MVSSVHCFNVIYAAAWVNSFLQNMILTYNPPKYVTPLICSHFTHIPNMGAL